MESKRDCILRAAIEVFYAHGFSAATIDLVAQSADVSRQTVYRYFRDKESLFKDAVMHLLDVHERKIQMDLVNFPESPPDIAEALFDYGHAYALAVLSPEWRTLRHVIDPEYKRFPELFGATREHGPRRYRIALAGHLARFALAGRIDIEDPELAARQFITLMFDPTWNNVQYTEDNIDPNELNWILRANLQLFLRAYPLLKAAPKVKAAARRG
jgi:AcrR family transcriptional regulator